MYNFVYYFIYRVAKKKNPAPKTYSAGGVFMMLGIHLLIPVGVMKYFYGWTPIRLHEEYLPNKLLLMPIFIIIFLVFNKYFEKRSEAIFEQYDKKYKKGKKLYSVKNIIWITALYIIPLLIGIRLINMSS